MVFIKSNPDKPGSKTKIRLLLCTTTLGILFLTVPLFLTYVDPIMLIANYQLRVVNGGMVHELLKKEIEGPKILISVFNITNADRFLAGEDDKLVLDEIGPFVFQEYRTIDDLEINKEPGIMRYTPHLRVVFLEEESYAKLEDVQLVIPNISLLAATSLLSSYPYFIKQIFNMMSIGMKSKAFMNMTAYDYIWGTHDPWIDLCNSVVPGLIYFNSSGLMDRFIDPGVGFRMELGTSKTDKFQVKKVTKFEEKDRYGVKNVQKNVKYYNNTYEGAAFPSPLTPNSSINIYRHSICREFGFKYNGTKMMNYGSSAYEFHFSNETFNAKVCYNDWCPYGLLDLSPCYLGFPFIISKGHFLDADPKLLEKFIGITPNRSADDTHLLIDPKIGLGVGAHLSTQLNLGIGNVAYNKETKRLKNMVLPLCIAVLKHPRLPPEAVSELRLMYFYGPYIILTSKILCTIVGILVLGITFKLIILNRKIKRTNVHEDEAFLKQNCDKRKKISLDIDFNVIK